MIADEKCSHLPGVAVTGSSGLIGSALVAALSKRGFEVTCLKRNPEARPGDPAFWSGITAGPGQPPRPAPRAVVHLAAETIAQRWTPAARERIRRSRVEGSRSLVESLLRLQPLPRVVISASATGIHGNRGDEMLDEWSSKGEGFLANLAQEWEDAFAPLTQAGVRVVFARFGIVLSPHGGALAKMLLPFRLGLGGKLGSGRMFWSWISLPDAVSALCFLLEKEDVTGPVNVVSPFPVRQHEFAQTLASVLKRPCILSTPGWVLNLAMGDMAREALLASFNVQPRKLLQSGFQFRHPRLHDALQHILSKGSPS
ncbi:MAG: TIGR01777 family protein [Verrucomicrobia bacterium]|nr:TIGR01777 family protein [Verrucomicrobiota bacterium]